MTTLVKFSRVDTAANFASANPVLADGEIVWEKDTERVKVGDGVTAYNTLPYRFEGVTDHGALTGLADNDHPQYALTSSLSTVATSGDHSDLNLDDGTNPHGTTKTDVGLSNVPNVDATDRANHTGTQLSSSISDFNSAVQSAETNTTLITIGNTLRYTNEDGTQFDIDLSTYLDDTNLSRIISGTLNPTNGIATFTRDDSSTFTIDFSSLVDIETVTSIAFVGNHTIRYTDEDGTNTDLNFVARQNVNNQFSESQSISKSTGIASLEINSDDNESTVIFRAGTPENLWAIGADDFTNQFVITSTNGLGSAQEFNINIQNNTINFRGKRGVELLNPVSAQDAATKNYVDTEIANIPPSVGSIDDLTDVDTSTNAPGTGDLLEWDGSNWIPTPTQQGYTYFPVWAEEASGLNDNNAQYSFGNGASGVIGVPLGLDAELFACSINALTFGTQVTVDYEKQGVNQFTATFNSNNQVVDVPTPISWTKGESITFKTNTETGNFSNVRVCAWFRIPNRVIAEAVSDKLFTPNGLTQSLTVGADQSVTLNGYGAGSITGTKSRALCIDSSGKIIEDIPQSVDMTSTTVSGLGLTSTSTPTSIPGMTTSVSLQANGVVSGTFTYSALRSGIFNSTASFRVLINGTSGTFFVDTLSTFNDTGVATFSQAGLTAGTYTVTVEYTADNPVTLTVGEIRSMALET